MITQHQRAIDGMTVLWATTKSAKELDELLKAAPSSEWRKAVRLAKKLRSERLRWEKRERHAQEDNPCPAAP